MLFNRPSPLRYIRGGWTSRARKKLRFTSKTLVKFGLVLSDFPKLFGLNWLHLAGLFCGGKRSRTKTSPKAILTISTRRTTFMLEVFFITDHLEGQIGLATQAISSLYPSHMCLVGRATSRLLTGLHSDCSNFCILIRIWTIFISKSIVSTRRI